MENVRSPGSEPPDKSIDELFDYSG